MIKKSALILLAACCLFACRQSTKTVNNADTVKRVADTLPRAKDTGIMDTKEPVQQQQLVVDTSKDTVNTDWLITPGKSIGHIKIDDNVATVITLLGRPDSSDAAMGSSLMAWFAKHNPAGYRTAVFAHHNMGGKDEAVSRVQKILITSPKFKTRETIGVGTDKENIEPIYTLKPTSTYNNHGHKVQVYTDLARGISFEIDNVTKKCVGIVVHKENDTASAYINMH